MISFERLVRTLAIGLRKPGAYQPLVLALIQRSLIFRDWPRERISSVRVHSAVNSVRCVFRHLLSSEDDRPEGSRRVNSRRGALIMRHGSTVFPTLIILGLGLGGLARSALGGEPLDDRLGRRTVPIFLLTRSEIQADLKLTSEQVTECHRAARTFQRLASRLIGRKDSAVVAVRREIDDAMIQWLSEHLSPQQLGRLDQIDLQWEGATAMLSRPFLYEGLNLTDEQIKKVRQCVAESNAQRARGVWTYDDHINQIGKAVAILDDRQQKLWIDVLGRACAFKIGVNTKTARNEPAGRVGSNPTPPRR